LCVGHLQRKGDVAWAARFGVASPAARLPGAPLVIQHGRSAAGGWKDVTTLINCYQQPDEDTLRSVVEFSRPAKQAGNRKRPGVRSQKLLTQ
jgi:hypothetical protein